VGWQIIVGAWGMGPDLAFEWVRTRGLNYWRAGLIAIQRFVWVWILLTVLIGTLNITWWQSTSVWTWMSPITFVVTLFLLLWATPIAFLWAAAQALVEFPELSSLRPREVTSFLTKLPKGWWERTTAHANRWIHTAVWILLGEVIAFSYLHIFQVWKYPAALPLLLHAVAALILLERLHTPEERKMRQGRSIRPMLTSMMVTIVVICTWTFILPQLAEALRNGLGKVDAFLTIPQVLPLVAFLLIGAVVNRQGAWAKWLMIMVPALYLEVLGVRAAIVFWALPTMIWLFAAMVVANLTLVGFGLMLKEDAEHQGRRALVALSLLVIFIGYATKPNYYRPHKVVTTTGATIVVSDVMVCPVDHQEFRGDKAKFDVCPRHGKDLVPFTSLAPAVRDSIQAKPNNRDYPRVNLAGVNWTGADSDTIPWPEAIGGTP
jgi:hypothetical protein